tara:strand:- start:3391 stop:3615 length:225 start_codon:yes stop_codon:yes gene_type:complete
MLCFNKRFGVDVELRARLVLHILIVKAKDILHWHVLVWFIIIINRAELMIVVDQIDRIGIVEALAHLAVDDAWH